MKRSLGLGLFALGLIGLGVGVAAWMGATAPSMLRQAESSSGNRNDATASSDVEATRIIRLALLETQLRPLFQELTCEQTSTEAATLWPHVRQACEPSLLLASQVILAEPFDPVKAQQAVRLAQAALIRAIAQQAVETQQSALRVIARSRQEMIAQRLARTLERDLVQRVGHGLAKTWTSALAEELEEMTRRLDEADAQLAVKDDLEKWASKLDAIVRTNREQLKNAETQGVAENRRIQQESLRQVRVAMIECVLAWRKLSPSVKSAIESIARSFPSLNKSLHDAWDKVSETRYIRERAPDAVEVLHQQASAMHELARTINQARAAARTQLALELAESLRRSLRSLTEQFTAANEARVLAQRTGNRFDQLIAQSRWHSLQKPIERAAAVTHKLTARLDGAEQRLKTALGRAFGLSDQAQRTRQLQTDLEEVRSRLKSHQLAEASVALERTVQTVSALHDDLGSALRSLDAGPGESITARITQELDSFRHHQLAETIQASLQQTLNEQFWPTFRPRLDSQVNQWLTRARAVPGLLDGDTSEALFTAIQNDLPGEDTIERVLAPVGEAVPSIDPPLPPKPAKAPLNPETQRILARTREWVRREIPIVVNALLQHSKFDAVVTTLEDSLERRALLIERSTHLAEQLTRRGDRFLPAADPVLLVEWRLQALAQYTARHSPPPLPLPATPPQQVPIWFGVPLRDSPTIQIDGDLSDWADLEPLLLSPPGDAPNKANQREASKAWLAYDVRGLLIAVEVTDPTFGIVDAKPLETFWENDAVEVFIDTLNSKLPRRGERTTRQVFALPFGHVTARDQPGYEVVITLDNESRDGPWPQIPLANRHCQRSAKKTAKGWTLELLLSRDWFGAGVLQPGRSLGFNLQLDTGGPNYLYCVHPGRVNVSRRPDLWGDLRLLGTDAQVTAVREGTRLRLEVADADQNRDPAVRDRVLVVVRQGEQSVPVILTETSASSGRFEGSLPISENAAVEVEYFDAARTTDGGQIIRTLFASP